MYPRPKAGDQPSLSHTVYLSTVRRAPFEAPIAIPAAGPVVFFDI
jgi:hypothetical protein